MTRWAKFTNMNYDQYGTVRKWHKSLSVSLNADKVISVREVDTEPPVCELTMENNNEWFVKGIPEEVLAVLNSADGVYR